MNSTLKKTLLLLLTLPLLFGAGRLQQSLNHDRDALGLTRGAVLENAPPVLAFTTVALGGFRGLISNLLWIRANDLQQDDKFFEAAQLADWITKLEPTFAQVWVFQAWNMAFNISVKFKENAPGDYTDRWRWLENGVALLRDEGLRYNPNDIDIFRELAWLFQFKIGANLDDGNMFYKKKWADEMTPLFGEKGTNIADLLNPPNADAQTNVTALLKKYRLDPQFLKLVDDKYGPFDWRLPEAHAIYWGAIGLAEADKNPDKVKADDKIKLRRIVYQSIYQAFKHGRIEVDPLSKRVSLGPNLELIPHVSAAYEEMMAADAGMRDNIAKAHRNFLRDAVYFLYEHNRMADAAKWFKYLGDTYPNKPIIENQPNSLPKNLTLDEYAVAVVQIDIGETSQERVTSAVQGLLFRAYYELAAGEDDRYENFRRLANKVYLKYEKESSGYKGDQRIPLPPYDDLRRQVINSLIDPQEGLPFAARQVIRTRLGLPAETVAPATTNSVPNVSTNSPAQ
jgi:hypothetical protein